MVAQNSERPDLAGKIDVDYELDDNMEMNSPTNIISPKNFFSPSSKPLSWFNAVDHEFGDTAEEIGFPEDQLRREENLDSPPWLEAMDKMHENIEWGATVKDVQVVEVAPTPIHIMGLNKYGNFIAQSLANGGAPVTLLAHRPLIMQDWHDEGQSIRLLRDGEVQTVSGFNIESTATDLGQMDPENPIFKRFGENLEHTSEPPDTVIETLFVVSNPGIILSSLSQVAHRLRPYSTVCFCQDGLGIIDKVNKLIFPDPDERPNYMLANLTHKLESGRGIFDVAEISGGILTCSKLPRVYESTYRENALIVRRKNFSWSPTSKYLVGALLQAPGLNTETVGHKSFHRHQLMNVAMHALIDSISVAFEVKCDELLYNYKISQYMKMVLLDISRVIRALPELDTIPNVRRDFSVEKLQARAVTILTVQGDKYTDFLMDTRAGRIRTGMDYYSGYILDRAKELKIRCLVLEALMMQVEGKQQYYSRRARNFIPFDLTNRRAIADDDDGKV